MMLTGYQQKLVEQHIGLVGRALNRCIRESSGLFARDDLYQIGCIGLCKAAMTYKKGTAKFSTYAYYVIRNEIISALRKANTKAIHETGLDDYLKYNEGAAMAEDKIALKSLQHDIKEQKETLSGVSAKGVDVILLRSEGLSFKEIGDEMHAPENHVRAWAARARKKISPRLEYVV